MIQITDLSHMTLIVGDLERSARFYRDVLELEEVPTPRSFTHSVRWFRRGGAEVHLIDLVDSPQAPGDLPAATDERRDIGRARHLAFQVTDIEATVAALERRGVQVVLGPRPRGDGAVQLYVYDPDAHLIELHTPPDGQG